MGNSCCSDNNVNNSPIFSPEEPQNTQNSKDINTVIKEHAPKNYFDLQIILSNKRCLNDNIESASSRIKNLQQLKNLVIEVYEVLSKNYESEKFEEFCYIKDAIIKKHDIDSSDYSDYQIEVIKNSTKSIYHYYYSKMMYPKISGLDIVSELDSSYASILRNLKLVPENQDILGEMTDFQKDVYKNSQLETLPE